MGPLLRTLEHTTSFVYRFPKHRKLSGPQSMTSPSGYQSDAGLPIDGMNERIERRRTAVNVADRYDASDHVLL
jgi:hypothetical protein